MGWYLDVLKKYVLFSGRAHRPEFWYFMLVNVIILIVLRFIDGTCGMIFDSGLAGGLSTLYTLAVLLPYLGVGVRRLHDTGRTGWWILLGVIPLIGTLILIYLYAQPGEAGDNEYGPPPTNTEPGMA